MRADGYEMKPIIIGGKRRRAVARASLKTGSGIVRVNKVLLDHLTPEIAQMRIMEALELAKPKSKTIDITVTTRGGGMIGQAEAARLAIAKGIVAFTKDKKIEKAYLDYDRTLLVADVRRKETRKPNAHGKARAKRQKSYR